MQELDDSKFYKLLEELEALPKHQQIMIIELVLETWRLQEVNEIYKAQNKVADTES